MPTKDIPVELRALFVASEHDSKVFKVARYQGTDAVSSTYSFTITLLSNDATIEGDTLINKGASLLLRRYNEFFPYSGIITSFKYIETTVDHSTYEVVLQPTLFLLNYTTQSRVFLKKSVPEIVKEVLDGAGLTAYYDMQVGTYPPREYVVQYQESDLQFINRLMEACGIWYFFTEDPIPENSSGAVTIEKLVITDAGRLFDEVSSRSAIKYRTKSGIVDHDETEHKETVFRLESTQNLVPESVMVKNYNYRTPEIDLSLTTKIDGGNKGEIYRYGGTFKDSSGAEKSADLTARSFVMSKSTLSGASSCVGFRAGKLFTLEEHTRISMNAMYLLITIQHSGTDPNFFQTMKTSVYENKFDCIVSEFIGQFTPERKTPKPHIPGIITAMIETEGSEYAALDEKGRYKVRMSFDRSEVPNYNASKYIRLAQPYSGADYGIHFPSHEGTEMIIGHIDGDPDKPLGLGTVPHANTISPVKSTNKMTSVIRTAGNNEMIMDDTADAEKISIYTPKDLSITADNDESVTIKRNSTTSIGADESTSIGRNSSLTVKGTLTETIEKDTTIKVNLGNYDFSVVSGSSKTKINKKVEEIYDDTLKTTVAKKVELQSTGDEIIVTAATSITLKCGQSEIKMSNDGTIAITGTKVSMTAKTGLASVDGVQVALAAKTAMTIEGANIESKAKVSHNTSGSMVASDGKVMNVIKGGMVQLNP